jgi:energy-coupling factor transport system ATP-binding protein
VTAVATVRGLRYRYPGRPVDAIAGLDLTIEPGEVIVLAGPSGCGKTTVLRALAGLVPHFHGGTFAGAVHVSGHDTRSTAAATIARSAGLAFQDPEAQIVYADVLRDVAFGLENHGVAVDRLRPEARAALARVGATHLGARRTDTISGGELQRVALAGVLAPRPALLLLDEPTAQLDDAGAATLVALLRTLADEGIAVVVAEHRLDRIGPIADRTVRFGDDPIAVAAPPGVAPTTGGRPLLRAVGIRCVRGGGTVLDDAALDLRAGEVVALHGPNGAGKTTLLRTLAGLDPTAVGSIELDGRDVTAIAAEHRYPTLALVPQDPGRYLLRDTVRGEITLSAARAAEAAIDALDLRGLLDRHPHDLSAGERERVALAAALAADPAVLLLDEPTRGMDPGRRADLARCLRDRAATGRSVLVATHDRAFATAAADRTLTIAGGRLDEERPG